MKPYRGTLLATVVLLAALPLSSCGDADDYAESGAITLTSDLATVEVNKAVTFTVISDPLPPKVILDECSMDLEYMTKGAKISRDWTAIPGTGPVRIFALVPKADNPLNVMARGRCHESREEWQYSEQVTVTVTEEILPLVTAVTLTASASTVTVGETVFFTLGATTESGCTLRLKYQYTGSGLSGTVDPASVGTFPLTPLIPGVTLTVIASGWCAENPSAVVSSDSVVVTVE